MEEARRLLWHLAWDPTRVLCGPSCPQHDNRRIARCYLARDRLVDALDQSHGGNQLYSHFLCNEVPPEIIGLLQLHGDGHPQTPTVLKAGKYDDVFARLAVPDFRW